MYMYKTFNPAFIVMARKLATPSVKENKLWYNKYETYYYN